ncbi:MAG: glycoside hydrolase, partial [Gemmatimonas sp.]
MHHVVVHAHCYQPPREDPRLEVVETEQSAAPDHDWNARIDRECYARLAEAEARQPRAGAAAGDPDAASGISRLVNLYAWCNFDVGATLCEWMDSEAPTTLRAMVDGDAASVRRLGHGNAIAAPYHHVILPLASPRDRRTEVRWGIADFRRRFGRAPEGLWLPECAADEDTLDLLAEEGVQFTILAPYQIETTGETHGLPVRWRGAAGRSLTILPYDGNLAGEVAFGGLLRNASALARRLAPALHDGQARCTTLATDGETFGHHHKNGDRALALSMALIAQRSDAKLTNAATMVATHPPTLEARLVSRSSWSCAHGVERWRSNCGCRIGQDTPPAQEWRGPLRAALTSL